MVEKTLKVAYVPVGELVPMEGNPRRNDAAGVRRNTVGWEFVHIAIDDATRLAYVEVLANEKAVAGITSGTKKG